jgi:tRNA-dihydrouridine synthase B
MAFLGGQRWIYSYDPTPMSGEITPSTPSFRVGNITFRHPLMLSPMAGFTNLPFRAAIRAMGGLSVATTDLVNARSLLELNPKAVRMVTACSDDRPLGVQLFGADKDELSDAARFLEDLGIDFIDINLGCPSDKVTRCGAGAALMQDEELTEELVEAVVRAVRIPVTVKMRLGWDEASINAHEIAPRLESMGVAAVAVHGRTKAQSYSGTVNLEAIRAVVQSVRTIPVIGNGDVHSPADAKRMIEDIGCRAVMVGRAALRDPFFFRRAALYLKDGIERAQPGMDLMLLFMHYHFVLTIKLLGEGEACTLFRKTVTGYSDDFPQREKWRVDFNHLDSREEYVALVEKLCPGEMDDLVRRPVLDAGVLLAAIRARLDLPDPDAV